jgi:predicted metalloprotease with PDZ domain
MLNKFLWSHGARIKVDTLVDKPVEAGIIATVDRHNTGDNRYVRL